MKRWLVFLGMVTLFAGLVAAIPVDVHVASELGGDVEYLDMEKPVEDGLQTFRVQWYNSKSVSCMSRMEFEIYDDSSYTEKLTSVWSAEREMASGASDLFRAFWLAEEEGTYWARMRIHHCFDIIEKELGNFSVTSVPNASESIDIRTENLPGGKIRVTLRADQEVGDVVVLPTDAPKGWIFEAAEAVTLEPGKKTSVLLDYTPSVWTEQAVDVKAVSSDGRMASPTGSLVVKQERTFWQVHGMTVLAGLILLLVGSNLYLFLAHRGNDD